MLFTQLFSEGKNVISKNLNLKEENETDPSFDFEKIIKCNKENQEFQNEIQSCFYNKLETVFQTMNNYYTNIKSNILEFSKVIDSS